MSSQDQGIKRYAPSAGDENHSDRWASHMLGSGLVRDRGDAGGRGRIRFTFVDPAEVGRGGNEETGSCAGSLPAWGVDPATSRKPSPPSWARTHRTVACGDCG